MHGRGFKHRIVSQQVVALEKQGAAFEQVRDLVAGQRGKAGLESGDINAGIWSAGMVQGLINDVPTCKELIDRIIAQAEDIIDNRLAGTRK